MRPRQDVRRHVGDERHVAGVRRPLVLEADDGLVGADVDVGRLGVEPPLGARRDRREAARLAAGGDVDGAEVLGLGDRALGPVAGVDVVGARLSAQQVHRHDRVLADRAALQEEELVVVGNREQLAQQRVRLVVDRHELLAAMAHLHHRHAAAVPVEHLGGAAWRSTGSGRTAGPGLKLNGRRHAPDYRARTRMSRAAQTTTRPGGRVRSQAAASARAGHFSSVGAVDAVRRRPRRPPWPPWPRRSARAASG